MKFTKILTIAIAFSFFYCTDAPAQEELKTEEDSLSYALGYQTAKGLSSDGVEFNSKLLSAGLEDYQSGQSKLTEDEVRAILSSFQQKMMQKQKDKMQEQASKGKEWLEQNKQKPGVKVTDSGLQYKVLEEGSGKSPEATDNVKVHYHGTKIDGTVFDSSVERGQPAEFPLNRVIKGWTEGVQLMKEGAKYKFFIPSELAYGERGSGAIGPNEVLIFEVELLEVKK